MNALLRPPALTAERVLAEVKVGDDTVLKLTDRKLIRVVQRRGIERLLPATARRRSGA